MHNGGLRVKLPFFTIGHSNRTLEVFIDLLRAKPISPLSRTSERFRSHEPIHSSTRTRFPVPGGRCHLL